MSHRKAPWYRRGIALMAVAALAFAGGCGGGDSEDDNAIEWWHIANEDPMLSVWQSMATDFQAQNSGVTLNITPLENEAYKAKLTTVTQAGDPPDIFHTWGGGVLRQQVEAGLVKDITDAVQPWVNELTANAWKPYTIDGRIYGVPNDMGMVGFWYNKQLFADAGITAPPATWAELLDDVNKLKTAGVTPIALAGGDKWPGHYWWTYLVMRIAGLPGLQQAATDKNFSSPDCVAAGDRLKELVDLQPFQEGFLGAAYGAADGEAAVMGNGDAAMELMGQWAPATQVSASGTEGLGDDLGWFPFPAVDGGKGAVTDIMGGGGGFAVGMNAPDAATDFLKFISQVDNQKKAVATGSLLPVSAGAKDALADDRLLPVVDSVDAATGFQLYLDQDYAPAIGQEINNVTAELIAGTKSPQEVCDAITAVAQTT